MEECSNEKLNENPSKGSIVVSCGEMDVHNEASSRFSQFCERI